MSNLSKLVEEVKSFLKQKNEAKLVMQTAEGIDVTFEIFDESEIGVGVKASPDGEFTLSNGYKVKIENGEVTEVEVEVAVPEIPGEEGKKNEGGEGEGTGEGEASETSEPTEPSELEQAKKALEEANALIEQLKSQLAESTSQLEEKSKEIESIESDLNEIKNFYSKVNAGAQERQETNVNQEPTSGFKFKIK